MVNRDFLDRGYRPDRNDATSEAVRLCSTTTQDLGLVCKAETHAGTALYGHEI